MRNLFTNLLLLVFLTSCNPSKNILLLKEDPHHRYAYFNTKGDTIIPFGKYEMCFTDTIKNFGIVLDKKLGFIAIDCRDNLLFQVFAYDNGPDYISDGLFRIVEDGKIGYANELGKIVIPPRYECAYPFENGKAKVSLKCTKVIEYEHEMWNSNEWFYIDKKGRQFE